MFIYWNINIVVTDNQISSKIDFIYNDDNNNKFKKFIVYGKSFNKI